MPKGEDTRFHEARVVDLNAYKKQKMKNMHWIDRVGEKIWPGFSKYDPGAEPLWTGQEDDK